MIILSSDCETGSIKLLDTVHRLRDGKAVILNCPPLLTQIKKAEPFGSMTCHQRGVYWLGLHPGGVGINFRQLICVEYDYRFSSLKIFIQ
jgi:hypothetical protein